MKTNRRKFIANTTLSIIGLSLSNSLVGKTLKGLNSSKAVDTIAQMLRQAAINRRAGNLIQATSIYQGVIEINSAEVRAYDGIRKVLLQEKYKELEVLQLYLGGLNLNPDNALFKERTAKEYMRLALGNKKFKDQLNIPDDLLEKAKTILEQAKIELPSNEQIDKQLEKANRKLSHSANIVDARENPDIKVYKKNNHHNHKNRFQELSEEDTKEKLDYLLLKTKDDFRDVHIRELYKVYIYKLKKNGKFDIAVQLTQQMYLFDKKDSHALKIARNTCKRDQKYNVLEVIERKNDSLKKSYWSKVALFDVLYKRYRKEGVGSLSEMNSILNSISAKKYSFYHIYEYKVRQIKFAILQNRTVDAQILMNNFADSLIGTTSAHFIDKFNVLCSRYYKKINETEKAVMVLNIALKENNLKLSDPFLIKLVQVNRDKEKDKPIHVQRLLRYRDKLISGS